MNLANLVTIKDDKTVTTSLRVAEHFGKNHRDVMRRIDNLAKETAELNRMRNFTQTVTTRENPSGGAPIETRAYEMTRDGFFLLAMGFTGKQALKFKIDFIDAFNRMEQFIQTGGQLIPVKGYTRRLTSSTPRKPSKFNPEQCKQIGGIVKTAFESYHKKLEDAFGGQLSLPMKSDKAVNDSGVICTIPKDKADQILKADEWTITDSMSFIDKLITCADKAPANKETNALAKGFKFIRSALVRAETVGKETLFYCGMATEGKRIMNQEQALNAVKYLNEHTLRSGFAPSR